MPWCLEAMASSQHALHRQLTSSFHCAFVGSRGACGSPSYRLVTALTFLSHVSSEVKGSGVQLWVISSLLSPQAAALLKCLFPPLLQPHAPPVKMGGPGE